MNEAEEEVLLSSAAPLPGKPEEQAATRPAITPRMRAYAALIYCILALSVSGLFIRWAGVPGTVTSFFRMAFATLALTVIVVRRGEAAPPARKALLWLPLVGGLFTALDHTFWATAIDYTNVATATLLNNIAPIWVALVAFLFWSQKLSLRFWLGLGLTMAGAAVVLGTDLVQRPHLGMGDGLALFSSLFYAGYFLVTQRGREHFRTVPYVWLTTLVAAITLLGVNLALGRQLLGLPPEAYLLFVAAALISQISGYFALGYALGRLPAALVAPTMIAQPVLTALLAMPLIGEFLTPAQWLGGLTVLGGIYLVNKR